MSKLTVIIILLIFVTEIQPTFLLNIYQKLTERRQEVQNPQKELSNKPHRLNLKIYRLSPSEIEEVISHKSKEQNVQLFSDEYGRIYHMPTVKFRHNELTARNILIQ